MGHRVGLDESCFRRLDRFSNKNDEWKECRLRFLTSVGECDPSFADFLKDSERNEAPIDAIDLNPEQEKQSAILQARLISLTTKQAFAIVESTQGNGCEVWRLYPKGMIR